MMMGYTPAYPLDPGDNDDDDDDDAMIEYKAHGYTDGCYWPSCTLIDM